MGIEIVVRPGVDSALLAWRADAIAGCRGFALRRKIRRVAGSASSPNAENGGAPDADGFVEEIVASWVGFADGPPVEEGTRKPTTEWPIQKYLWSDFQVNPGDVVRYRVSAMTGTADNLLESDEEVSEWTEAVTIGAETEGHASVYFNRGIVASQWLARALPDDAPTTRLKEAIGDPGDPIRKFLAGPLGVKLVSLLDRVEEDGGHIYAALFELDDPELVPLLKKLRKRAHIVLANGSVKKKGADENEAARGELALCDVRDRMTAPRALAHNKFLVICDASKAPRMVWTGSTNWTETGLCTQANNALLIDNPALASFYLDQWQLLAASGDATPETLYESNAEPRVSPKVRNTTLWFTPMHGGMDLDQAGELIREAREGILFAMFDPGPRGTLLNDIIELASPSSPDYKPDLYIQGVLNQNPGTAKNPVVLFNRGEAIEADQDVVLPAAIPGKFSYWKAEVLKLPTAHAMVHSKVVVIDPYGEKPVVMTGSHNLGPKASGTNDENFLIITGNHDLASQYAGKIMEIYAQYRWRQSVARQHGEPRWKGLAEDDRWQIAELATPYDKRRLRELDFWFGQASGN